ncbi:MULTISPECIES: hypothetical protein [Microbacterium]|uniref:hypothetical protein n=1 Tax=Microbacterium TaxID=33882 RepID=UPI000D645556|nr:MULTISPECIES: hypothetical protein [Microbacterium]
MVEYKDADGNPLTEDEALALPTNERFTATWDDGRSVECIVSDEGKWTVGHRSSGELKHYGAVVREGEMYQAANIVYMKPQETFSAAARKYL